MEGFNCIYPLLTKISIATETAKYQAKFDSDFFSLSLALSTLIKYGLYGELGISDPRNKTHRQKISGTTTTKATTTTTFIYTRQQRRVCNLPHWVSGILIFSCVSWSSLLSCVILNDCVYTPKVKAQ